MFDSFTTHAGGDMSEVLRVLYAVGEPEGKTAVRPVAYERHVDGGFVLTDHEGWQWRLLRPVITMQGILEEHPLLPVVLGFDGAGNVRSAVTSAPPYLFDAPLMERLKGAP